MYADHPAMVRGDDYTFWKDMIEVPAAAGCLVGLAMAVLRVYPLTSIMCAVFLPFLVFEIFFAKQMLRGFLDGIFFGFVMFLRAFARLFGLSTGILLYLLKKAGKKMNKTLKHHIPMLI